MALHPSYPAHAGAETDRRADRYPWLDAARLFACFGVIVIHCSPTTPSAAWIVGFFLNFAVPFFLLSSLFFFVQELTKVGASPRAVLTRRLPRLLLPYFVWTAIYLGLRELKTWMVSGEFHGFSIQDIVQIAFFGASGVHLYFIPLLLLALLLAWFFRPLLLWMTKRPVLAWCVTAFTVAAVLMRPHFSLSQTFQPLDGWIDLALLHIVTATALLAALRSGLLPVNRGIWAAIFITAWLALNIGWSSGALPYLWLGHGLLLAVLLVLTCIALGAGTAPVWLKPIQHLSYGVYLSHQLFLEAFEFGAERLSSRHLVYSLSSILLVAMAVFGAAILFYLLLRRLLPTGLVSLG